MSREDAVRSDRSHLSATWETVSFLAMVIGLQAVNQRLVYAGHITTNIFYRAGPAAKC